MNKEPFLQRFGHWVAGPRTKWITLVVWVVLAAMLSMLWPAVNSQEINNAPNLDESFPSVQADRIVKEQFPGTAGVPALLVWHRDGGLTDSDLQSAQKLLQSLAQEPLPETSFVPPLHQIPLPALKEQLSADRSTLVTPVFFNMNADTDILKENIESVKEKAKAIAGGDPFEAERTSTELSVRITGPVGIQVDATALFKNADVTLLLSTVLLVLVLLLLIYRSPILALIPLVGVAFAYGVISPVLGKLAQLGWITIDAQSISIMTVLLFGAGTDYCLFLIARFRQLLTEERDKGVALRKALFSSTGAIAMSGFTVVLSLLALAFAEYGAYQRFAVPFSLSILVMSIASLTLVPALLAIFGRGSFYPFVPRTDEMLRERAVKRGKPIPQLREKGRIGRKLGSLVVEKPWLILIVTVVLLGGLAGYATQIRYTYDILSSFPKDMPSREGFATIGERLSPGELAPVQIIVDTKGKPVALQETLAKLPYAASVSKPEKGKTNTELISVTLKLNLNPYSSEASALIPDLKQQAEQALGAAGIAESDRQVWVGGQTATQYDTEQTSNRDDRVIIPIVIALIAFLLLAYLRSVTAMLYLMGTVILSYFSALGLGWLVLHHFMGTDAIQGFIPLYAFVFLVALGEDYNIFMISSIWQKRKTMPLRQAIREGVRETGSVITSAGLILAGTFAVLATLPIQVLVQFGTITAIGVLLDTFLVRPFLVPAITTLLGRHAFWPSRHTEVSRETLSARE
ncbi:MMPL family transporter [Paenibacillus koleovorans]|uniref:MMPL family transporter n=1 Tax=Paenibacillus koleovorans TaxID=121608 RepID=UPI000FD7729B|nr:MMPL family transporter [Paenibacillus koleovorans]